MHKRFAVLMASLAIIIVAVPASAQHRDDYRESDYDGYGRAGRNRYLNSANRPVHRGDSSYAGRYRYDGHRRGGITIHVRLRVPPVVIYNAQPGQLEQSEPQEQFDADRYDRKAEDQSSATAQRQADTPMQEAESFGNTDLGQAHQIRPARMVTMVINGTGTPICLDGKVLNPDGTGIRVDNPDKMSVTGPGGSPICAIKPIYVGNTTVLTCKGGK